MSIDPPSGYATWHQCRGKTWRPYSHHLCSLCRGELHGSYDLMLPEGQKPQRDSVA